MRHTFSPLDAYEFFADEGLHVFEMRAPGEAWRTFLAPKELVAAGNFRTSKTVTLVMVGRHLDLVEKLLASGLVVERRISIDEPATIRVQLSEQKWEKRKRVRVLIVDDTKTIRKVLRTILEKRPEFEIVGECNDPIEAMELMKNIKVDVISLDLQMPRMSGLEFLEGHLARYQIPVVVLSGASDADGPLALRSLEVGACDFVPKPAGHELASFAEEYASKLFAASSTKVSVLRGKITRLPTTKFRKDAIVLIGASTGGTVALSEIFSRLPAQIPPIVVVQHIPPVYSKLFADRLNASSPFEVKEAEDGDQVQANRILIAPGDRQIKIVAKDGAIRLNVNDDPAVLTHRPSVDYLFNHALSSGIKDIVAFVLTGMGKDGAEGLLNLRTSGAITFAQDRDSSVVYGMPREAMLLGGAMEEVGLDQVAERLVESCRAKGSGHNKPSAA